MVTLKEEFCEFMFNPDNRDKRGYIDKRIEYNKKICNIRYLGKEGKKVYNSFIDNEKMITKKLIREALSIKDFFEKYAMLVIMKKRCKNHQKWTTFMLHQSNEKLFKKFMKECGEK